MIKDDKTDDKIIMFMAFLGKAMEQADSILKDDSSQRLVYWKTQLYTINEDAQDYLLEKNGNKEEPETVIK